MQSLTRCQNSHYYDAEKHMSCPYCGVQDLELDIQKTMAKRSGTNKSGFDAGNRGQTPEEGKTMGIYRRKMGIDPVVGWLVAIKGPAKGQDYRISSERNFIGRSEKMDISIPEDESISRETHAVVSYNPKNNSFRIFSGESKSLVYLNDEEVIAAEQLKPFDKIEVGETVLVFVPFCGENFIWEK